MLYLDHSETRTAPAMGRGSRGRVVLNRPPATAKKTGTWDGAQRELHASIPCHASRHLLDGDGNVQGHGTGGENQVVLGILRGRTWILEATDCGIKVAGRTTPRHVRTRSRVVDVGGSRSWTPTSEFKKAGVRTAWASRPFSFSSPST